MSTTAIPDRFTTLPDEHALQATVVALEEHGFSVEVAGDWSHGIDLRPACHDGLVYDVAFCSVSVPADVDQHHQPN